MSEPQITVVTATVNRPSLKKAVESVQNQTLRPVKHCILFQQLMREPVIDLEPPKHVPIIIRWLPPPQPNIVGAYNAVESMADTPLVAMLDDDCWWEPNHLEHLYELMHSKSADFVWSSSVLHDEDTGDVVMWRDDDEPKFRHIDTNEILYRRECVEKWGGFKEEEADPDEFPKLRGIDGKRIERWVANGATYAHSSQFTNHYGWRIVPEF